MDGGIDADFTRSFGSQLERRVQDEIRRVSRREQPVGTCLMMPFHWGTDVDDREARSHRRSRLELLRREFDPDA